MMVTFVTQIYLTWSLSFQPFASLADHIKCNKSNEQTFLTMLRDMTNEGRSNPFNFRDSMTFWVYMCLGEHAQQDHKTILSSSSNFIKNLKTTHKKQLHDKRIEDFISIADEAMTRLCLENNLYEQDGMIHFADNTARLKYMKRNQVGKVGSRPMEEILHYEEIYNLVLQEHQNCLAAEDDSHKWSFVIGSDDEDDNSNSTMQVKDVQIMILEVDHSAFN